MTKLSSVQIKSLMKEASEHLKKMASELEEKQAKIAYFERKEDCEKIADLMEANNVKVGLSYKEKVAELMETKEDLKIIKAAILLEPDTIKTASLAEKVSLTLDPFHGLLEFLDNKG